MERKAFRTQTPNQTAVGQERGGQRGVARWGCGCGRGPVGRTVMPGQGVCWLSGLYGEHLWVFRSEWPFRFVIRRGQ